MKIVSINSKVKRTKKKKYICYIFLLLLLKFDNKHFNRSLKSFAEDFLYSFVVAFDDRLCEVCVKKTTHFDLADYNRNFLLASVTNNFAGL